jgi:hypothetical protein
MAGRSSAATRRPEPLRFAAHPERFVHGAPRAQRPPAEVGIKRPAAQVVKPLSGVAEPPPEASVRPSPARSADREVAAQATERPEPPGPTRSAPREHGEDGEDATLPKQAPAVPLWGDGRSGAGEPGRVENVR